jgi:hypothetical protein
LEGAVREEKILSGESVIFQNKFQPQFPISWPLWISLFFSAHKTSTSFEQRAVSLLHCARCRSPAALVAASESRGR